MSPSSVVRSAAELYRMVITSALRSRSERASHDVPSASVARSALVGLRWYEWPAARELQREGHGVIEGANYRAWVDATPRWALIAMAARGRA
jgi:hypothetical protein